MKVIAIDPGGTTGVVIFEIDTIMHGFVREHFRWQHVGNNSEHHQDLWTLLVHEHPDHIVCERFDNSGDQFTKIMSREYIGVVKLYSALFDVPITWQGADQAKNWAPNDRLQILTLLIAPASKWKHANDAMRHMVYWIIFKGGGAMVGRVRALLLEMTRES